MTKHSNVLAASQGLRDFPVDDVIKMYDVLPDTMV